MTEHRPGMRLEISRTLAPDGSVRVLFQADEWHMLLPPGDALDVAASLEAVARGILAERN